MSTALRREIRERIQREGPLDFAEYMRLALYHPQHGYYAARVPGLGAGYRTSPVLTPAFGVLVGRALQRMWAAMGCPDGFVVIEFGGGRGDLAAAAWGTLPPEQSAAMQWRFVEPFEDVRRVQKERLEGLRIAAEWVSSLEEGPPVTGCVIANEVLDNFPVHLFEVGLEGPLEIFVGVEGERLIEQKAAPTAPELGAAQAIAAHLQPGDRFELRSGIDDWSRQVAGALERGWLLVFDYGDVAPDIWTRRPSGTLLVYRDSAIGHDPLNDPGEADITAHVDFSALSESARRAGLDAELVTTQREFLEGLGIDRVLRELKTAETLARRDSRHADYIRLVGERSRVSALASRGGLGDFLVLLAGKDVPAINSASSPSRKP